MSTETKIPDKTGQHSTDKVLGALALKLMGWIGPAIIGALLTVLVQSSGQVVKQNNNEERFKVLEARVTVIERDYATNKRVDDLVQEIRNIRTDLSSRMDAVIKILLEKR